MKIRRFIGIILGLVVLISTFSSCSNNKQVIEYKRILQITDETVSTQEDTVRKRVIDNFIIPDKIILYKNGTISTIGKNDKIFSDIVKYTNERIGETVDMAKLAFGKRDMDSMKEKETAIEFIYSKKQRVKINTVEKEYISLIFPLSGQYSELCFFNVNTNTYNGPVGALKQSSALLELIKK